jgi:site-specific recombinase XerD
MAQHAAERDVLLTYRTYLVRRGYARGTVAARVASARKWVADVPEWRSTDFRVVEEWVYGHKVTAQSQRNVIGYLRAFYRWAMREGLVERDATALVDAPRVPTLIPRPARDVHIGEVLAGADVELTAIIGLMACGGLRCCEVAALRWRDVDLHEGWVHVMGKGSKERRVFLNGDVVALVAALDGVDGPVFPSPVYGGHRSAARISQIVCRAFRAAGHPTTAHQLRHRAATSALAVPGADLLAVRDMLGHSSVSTTQGYTAVVPGRAAATSRAVVMPVSAPDSRAA